MNCSFLKSSVNKLLFLGHWLRALNTCDRDAHGGGGGEMDRTKSTYEAGWENREKRHFRRR